MRKRNKVKHLQRPSAHRNAMLSNMITSLFFHEAIKSTTAKVKTAGKMAEKLITRAKGNLKTEDQAKKIHNIREAGKVVRDKEVLNKLFNDIAPRVESRNGGYTRVIKVGRRTSDNSEMAILELVDKKPLAQLKEDRKKIREEVKSSKKKASTEASTAKPKKEKSKTKK